MPAVAGSQSTRRAEGLFTALGRSFAQRCHDWPTSLDCARLSLGGFARGSCGCTHCGITSKITWPSWNRSDSPREFIEVFVRAILTFHSIDDSGSVLSYPPKSLLRLPNALDRCDIPVLDLDPLLRPATVCGVALPFDVAIRPVFIEALPILRSYSAPAHLFLTTGFLGVTNRWPSQPASAPVFEMLRWSEV